MSDNKITCDLGAIWAIAVKTVYYDSTPRLYLEDANLMRANLAGANLADANLADANLMSAYLRGANLTGADLMDANLTGANLWGADLRDANLSNVDLRDANLRGANLWGADLTGANVSNTRILSIKGIGSSRGDNIYATPRYDDGNQIGWGFHLGCYYSDDYIQVRNRIVDNYGDGSYSRCLDMLYEMCMMVYDPK